MPEQELGETVFGAEQVRADVFAAAQQIANGFFLLGRNVNRCQCAGAKQHGELRGIASIRLDPVAHAAWDQGRRDHVARDPGGVQRPLQIKPARTRLVATSQVGGPHPRQKPMNGWQIRRQRMQRWRSLAG